MLLLHSEPSGFVIFGYDLARIHAVLNDFPVLLVVAVVFEIASLITRREALRIAAFWMLVAGLVGGAAAIGSGLLAEDTIQHGQAIHNLMEEHEELGLITGGIFFVITAWYVVRRARMTTRERVIATIIGVVGIGFLVDTGAHGGKLVFDHAAGIPNAVLESELRDRAAGHQHEEGEADAHDDDAAPTAAMPSDSAADTAAAAKAAPGHTHAPGTPPHAD